jgi:hypothetical protein
MKDNTATAKKRIHPGGAGRSIRLGGKSPRAVVVTVMLNGTEDAPPTFTDETEGVQIACAGAPLQEMLTELLKPLRGFTCRL